MITVTKKLELYFKACSCLFFFYLRVCIHHVWLHGNTEAIERHLNTLIVLKYCKCITFGDVFFLAPLVVVSIRQIKQIAKCAFIKVHIIKLIRIKRQFKSRINSQKFKFHQISYTLNIIHLQYPIRHVSKICGMCNL